MKTKTLAFRLRSSGQPKPSAAVDFLEDCICRALQTHSNGLQQLHGSRHDAARTASKRDEHNGVTGCTLCAWPAVFRRRPGCAARVRHPGEHQLSLTTVHCYCCYPPLAPKVTNTKHRQDSGRSSARGGCLRGSHINLLGDYYSWRLPSYQ